MKNPAKLFIVPAIALTLVACGGDKPSETSEPSAPAATNNSQPAAETSSAPQTTETASEPTSAPAESASTPAAASEPATKEGEAKADQQPAAEAAAAPVKALSIEEGKKRYETTCKVCHEQGLLEAPKLGDKAEWSKRMEKGIDTLHSHSAKGFNKMPAQATGDVSEAEVYAAVDYMVSQGK